MVGCMLNNPNCQQMMYLLTRIVLHILIGAVAL